MEIRHIALKDLKAYAHNSRKTFNEADMKELVASIKNKGIMNPIRVRPAGSQFEIICGERRFRAAKLLGLTDLPAIVHVLDDTQAMEYMVIDNLQRVDIHPLEEAEGYEALLKKHGYKTVADVAAKVGKSTAYIYGRLKLCELVPENRKLFYEGKLSPSIALLVARVPAHLQKEAGQHIVKGDYDGPLNFQDAKEYIHEELMLQLKEAQFDTKEKGLSGKCSCLECAKRTGNQKELFEDVKGADTCTDPVCFKAKQQAFTQRKLDELRKAGKKVLSDEEAKKAESYSSNYLKLKDTCYQAGTMGKRTTYGELVKKAKSIMPDVEVLHALNSQGVVVELITKPEAARILKKLGIKDESDDTKTRGDMVAEHKNAERVNDAKRAFWIEKIQKHMDQRTKNILLVSILSHDVGGFRDDDEILKGVDMMEDDFDDIYKLTDGELTQIIGRFLYHKPEQLEECNLEFLCAKLGFSMAKDYVITKEYLEACTKEQLLKLAHELNIADRTVADKKGALVDHILKHAPKGKVPKELTK